MGRQFNSRYNSYSQYNFSNNDNRGRRHYNDRNAEEPEWFSGGPTSQNDTIELRGFEEYNDRPDSPTRNSGDGDDDKATQDYDSETEKTNEEVEKANDTNNNDKGGNEEANQEANVEKSNNYDAEEVDVNSAEAKPNKKDDNFNIEDFLKVENLTDFLSVGFEYKSDLSKLSESTETNGFFLIFETVG